MRTRIVWLTITLLIGFVRLSPCHAQDGTNILINGGFEDNTLEPWFIYDNTGGGAIAEVVGDDPIEGDFCLHVIIPTGGTNFYDVGLVNPGYVFEQGKHYTLSAFYKCSEGTLQISFKPELGRDPYTGYGEQAHTITEEWVEYSVTTPVFAEDISPGNITFHIAFTEGEFWVDNVKFYEGDFVPTVLEKRPAVNPSPEDEATDICRDVILSWTPGLSAHTHDVYLGTSLEDVEDANRANDPHSLLVSPDQDSNSYDPPGLLEFSQTYYWRIDEVSEPPDTYIHEGKIWSFATESFSYPIPGNSIIATASSNVEGRRPENTVNSSGLDVNDLHSNEMTDMWLSEASEPGSAWIQYDLGKDYNLHQMLAWNYNGNRSNVNMGLKDVKVEYSIDGISWIEVNDVPEFSQAPGIDYYEHNIIVNLGGVTARHIKITAMSNHSSGRFDQYGLSEVRFFYIPARARKPVPAFGQADVALDAVLNWQAGREAAIHDIYIGTSEQEVAEANIPTESISAEGCEVIYVPSSFDLGQRYYWKVVEIDADSKSWESDVWNFSTLQNLVVDDFEDYNDYPPNEVWNTWIDGYENPMNGSTAGYPDPDFLLLEEHYLEDEIVHSGDWSMPLFYDNTGSIAYSEVTRTFFTPQDWTVKNVQMLTLFFRGDPPPFIESLDGNILMTGIGADIYQTTDEFNFAYKSLTGDGSITIRIDSIQYTHEWAKAGVMIRSGLEPLDRQADMICAPRDTVEWSYRTTTGQDAINSDTGLNSIEFPHWVRIRREGNTFIGQHSTDGINWIHITQGDPSSSSVDIQMPDTVYIGLVVTSHVSDHVCQAEFSEVSTTGNVTGQWQLADVGIAQNPGNVAERLYVVVEDNSGTTETYEHPDNPNAVLVGDWLQWNIPLSVFDDAGVDLTSIRKITIGVGDRTTPLHGAGMLLIDDVWLYTPLPLLPEANGP